MASFESFTDVNTGEKHSVFFSSKMYYRFDDGAERMVVSTSAWCFECSEVVAAEHLEDAAEREKMRLDARKAIEGDPDPSFIFMFMSDEPAEESAKKWLAELEDRWARFEDRKSPERCLQCGGTMIQKIELNENNVFSVDNGPTLVSGDTGMCDIGLESYVYFTAEGEKLAQPHDDA